MKKFDDSFKIGTKIKLDLKQESTDEWLVITEISDSRTLVKVKKYNLWITRERIAGYTNSEF